jgi:hypothetical protein
MATRTNLSIDQRTTFSASITFKDASNNVVDASTYTLLAQMRKTPTSINSISFSVSGNSSGVIVLSMNAAVTSIISSGRYVYDVLATDINGAATRVVEGQVTVNPAVSK